MADSPNVLLSTTPELPGHRITGYLGVVMGVSVVSRNAFSDLGAGIKSVVGGELKGYTRVLETGREQAVERLRLNASAAGANAVIGLAFDSGEFPHGAQMVAYGTAVTVEPA